MASCGRMVRDSAITVERLQETTIALQNGTIAEPLLAPSPKWGSQMHYPGLTTRRVLPAGEYDRRYQQNLYCVRHYGPSDVAFCQITVALVIQLLWCSSWCSIIVSVTDMSVRMMNCLRGQKLHVKMNRLQSQLLSPNPSAMPVSVPFISDLGKLQQRKLHQQSVFDLRPRTSVHPDLTQCKTDRKLTADVIFSATIFLNLK